GARAMSSPDPDAGQSGPGPNPPPPPPPKEPIFSTRRVLLAALPLVALVGFAGGMVYHSSTQVPLKPLHPHMVSSAQMRLKSTKDLDPRFTDADKDLVADRPGDPAQLADPEPLVFSYIAVDDPRNAETTWKPVMDHIAAATGKTVTYYADAHDADDQIEA